MENSVMPNFALRALLRDRDGAARGSEAPPDPGPPGEDVEPTELGRSLLRSPGHQRSTVESLGSLGVPPGLAKLLLEEDAAIAQRIFLLDNSGSTAHPDGCVMVQMPNGTMKKEKTTRWEEIKHMSLDQARWNLKLGTPCEFVLLNPAARGEQLEEDIDFVRIEATGEEEGDEAQVAKLSAMLQAASPKGATPLTERLRKIYTRVAPEARQLARLGQKLVLVIVTDGLPTNAPTHCPTRAAQKELARELRRISQDLPVHLVVRLCTNEDDVVEFYNSIDEEMELQLEVIDDIESEAMEIYKSRNRWLVYSPLVHRIREGGTFMKLFDLLDERALLPMEICVFCQLLLRRTEDDPPLPSDPAEFLKAVHFLAGQHPWVYDALRRRMSPPVLVDEVESALMPSALKRVCGGLFNQDCCVT